MGRHLIIQTAKHGSWSESAFQASMVLTAAVVFDNNTTTTVTTKTKHMLTWC